MSNKLDLVFRDNHSAFVNLAKTPTHSVVRQLNDATDRYLEAVNSDYDQILALSLHWTSDDTGAVDDCKLFQDTISKSGYANKVIIFPLADNAMYAHVVAQIVHMTSDLQTQRTLFILHYAGHGHGTPEALLLFANNEDTAETKPSFSFTPIKAALKDMADQVDVLFLMDCCCAAAGARMGMPKARIEFMAATTDRGTANSRSDDGKTFTQSWCKAFKERLFLDVPFTVLDIQDKMIEQTNLAQYPAIIVLKEGMELPIMFLNKKRTGNVTAVIPHIHKTVIAVFHLEEDPLNPAIDQLAQYLKESPVPISVLATLPTLRTLLLVRMPVALQDFLSIVPVLLLQKL